MIRFSVIIPLYNKAPYVAKTLQSVFDQTFTDWELIVVNDGSTDDSLQVTAEIIDGVSERFPARKVNLMSQNNSGVSTARNNGVAASHGEYVCFLDADDWWETTFLEEMDKLIKDFPDAGIYGTGYYLVKNGTAKNAPIAFDDGFERGFVDYIQVYSRYLCLPLTSITIAIKRQIFDEMGGFNPKLSLGEDFDLWLRIALKYKVSMVNKPLAYYNQDVNPANRGVRKKYNSTDSFMTFSFGQFSEYEKTMPALKLLLDKIRVATLLHFRRYNIFREETYREIEKVDFANVGKKYRFYYFWPYPIVWCWFAIREFGSRLKKSIV